MKPVAWLAATALLTLAFAPVAGAVPAEFSITSPAFGDDAVIPAEYSCHGRNIPPPLRWQNIPAEATSLAVVIDDPDAPAGTYVHWVVTGIPPSTTRIGADELPAGAIVSLNSARKAEYLGPCPPRGSGTHHYRFQLYALDKPVTVTPATSAADATAAIAAVTIATSRTVGTFSG